MSFIFAAAVAASSHVCVGDYVYQADDDGISIGAQVRQSPSYAEILFSDYGSIQSPAIMWQDGSVMISDQQDGSSIVMICGANGATLILSQDEWSPARTFKMRRTNGSLWEVGEREGWLIPND